MCKKSIHFFSIKIVYVQVDKKKKKEKKKSRWTKKKKAYDMDKTPTHLHRHFYPTRSFFFFFSSFLPFQGKSFLVGSVRKHQGLHYLFSLSSSKPNTLQNVLTPLLYIYIYIYIFSSFLKFILPNISKVYISRILHSTCIYICKVNIPSRVCND